METKKKTDVVKSNGHIDERDRELLAEMDARMTEALSDLREGLIKDKQDSDAPAIIANALTNTSREKLPELTEIPRILVVHLANQIALESVDNKERKDQNITVFGVWRNALYQLMRSVDRKHFRYLAGLAETQITSQAQKSESLFSGTGETN